MNLSNSSNASLVLGPSQVSSTLDTSNIIAAAFVAVLIIIALGGNCLVCMSFYTFRDLRTICNFFIISLSCADILVALTAMPFWLAAQLTNNRFLVVYPEVKKFWDSMDILCGTASIMNLVAVSVDRQFAITSPFTYAEIMTTRRALVLISCVWLYSILMACLRIIKWPGRSYLHFVSTFSFFLPLSVLIVMYSRIYLVARYQAKRIGKNYATDIKAAKTIAVVIGAFVACWLPFFVMVLGYAHSSHISFHPPDELFAVTKWLEYLCSCLNPIIYTCLNRTYRRAFRKLFLRCRRKIFKKESTENSTWVTRLESRFSVTQATAFVSLTKSNQGDASGDINADNKNDESETWERLTINAVSVLDHKSGVKINWLNIAKTIESLPNPVSYSAR